MTPPDASYDDSDRTDSDSDLPVPTAARTYLRIRPTDDPLHTDTVESHVRRLHRLESTEEGLTRFERLLGHGTTPPTVECLLLSTGGEDATLTYAFGIDDPGALDAVERILRGLFPDTYEFERTAGIEPQLEACLDSTDDLAAVEFYGHADRRRDWQTQLTPFEAFCSSADGHVPLAAVVETMATSPTPIVYQALLRPLSDWSHRAADRRLAIERHDDTLGGRLITALVGPPNENEPLSADDERRLEELTARDTRRCFGVNARLAVVGDRGDTTAPATVARELTSVFAGVSHTDYEIEGIASTETDAERVIEAIRNRTFYPPNYERLGTCLPWTANRSPGIVLDPTEVPNLWALDGSALTAAGGRLVAPTPDERTALPRPPQDLLENYRGEGLLLGQPLTQDGTREPTPLVLPPALQPMHVGWFGKTGSGKSTSLINAILTNHAATEGADILIDPKGDGMAIDYLRAHYAIYGTLENVVYFDCARLLPAISFFDIRDELDAGVPRPTAVEDTVDHYIELLTGIMGRERFDQAVRSPDVLRYLVKAKFDPIHGTEAFSHRDLHGVVRRMHDRQSVPSVSDDDLEEMLGGVLDNRARSFDAIMQGVANRMEKIPVDRRLAAVFNHVPDESDPHFDLADYLDENVVIVFDTGDLRSNAQRALALVILSNLWTALRRRSRRADRDSEARGRADETDNKQPDDHAPLSDEDSLPLVNCYIEEAVSIAVSDLLKQLLAQSRSFDCSVTLSMQFPGQLRAHHEDVYDEVLNNVSTVITGNIPADRRLAERLATESMSPQAVGNRLRALRRGQWLVRLPAAFDTPEPRPFLVSSSAPPPGDPAGTEQFGSTGNRAFEGALERLHDRTLDEAGLTLTVADVPEEDDEAPLSRVDSALPHTERLPPTVEYDAAIHALRCTSCDNRYDPTIDGMRRVIACCSSLEEIDRDSVPICDLNLKLTAEERAASDWSDHQLMFLQAVYNAQQRRYDPLEYDLLRDSMLRLQEYVGIETDAIRTLLETDYLRHDTDHPHRLYTVTHQGRELIGESYRRGVDYGHGVGDLDESSLHVFAVEVACQYLEDAYVADPDSPVVEVVPYYDLGDRHLLDVAGLDADGEITVTVEAERVNNDVRRAAPADFDKMADCDVDEAIWVVMTQSDGRKILDALNDPADGNPRVEKTYAPTTPPQQYRIDTPGLTAVYPAGWLRDTHSTDD